jgi:hypothetical protein
LHKEVDFERIERRLKWKWLLSMIRILKKKLN